eukprot:TRINITY_DN67893_c0_g1_i1.p1 TRINITY_DN67893_c0_g1~~TRINITY_DN67893_c0_g1_i1.p1  ORF type:complete len:396 (-),score=53.24 TRINITY_DN67893_c0_g1_i1:157-1344(-)
MTSAGSSRRPAGFMAQAPEEGFESGEVRASEAEAQHWAAWINIALKRGVRLTQCDIVKDFSSVDKNLCDQIDIDLGRVRFIAEGDTRRQLWLKMVLVTYLKLHPDVQYEQAMSRIVAFLISVCSGQDSTAPFEVCAVFAYLMDFCMVKELLPPDSKLARTFCEYCETLLRRNKPKLFEHLLSEEPNFFRAGWPLHTMIRTLFVDRFIKSDVIFIFDKFLEEGSLAKVTDVAMHVFYRIKQLPNESMLSSGLGSALNGDEARMEEAIPEPATEAAPLEAATHSWTTRDIVGITCVSTVVGVAGGLGLATLPASALAVGGTPVAAVESSCAAPLAMAITAYIASQSSDGAAYARRLAEPFKELTQDFMDAAADAVGGVRALLPQIPDCRAITPAPSW